jgi:hypothetical protein
LVSNSSVQLGVPSNVHDWEMPGPGVGGVIGPGVFELVLLQDKLITIIHTCKMARLNFRMSIKVS